MKAWISVHSRTNAYRVGPVGGDALNPAAQPIDGWEAAVWHGVRMADGGSLRQVPPPMPSGRCSWPQWLSQRRFCRLACSVPRRS